ncbi:ATP-dependent DNA ligase [Gramella sp. BOM4]|nr:ATP-dependent DNA ligase [Christiangramia bathymodioli]
MSEPRTYDKQEVELSNLEKVFFPESGYTKGDLVDYYERIADTMLPYIEGRPLTMIRFPNGIDDKKFFQKDAPDYFPDWIAKKSLEKKEGGSTNYVICNDKASLVYLANQACVTPHIWLSRQDKPEKPDRMIFDLDPSQEGFDAIKEAAFSIRELLENELGLPLFLMTTGSRGLHLVTPLKREHDFDEVRDFAQQAAKYLERQFPDTMTTATRKQKREDKLFLDVARNAWAQTSVAPYAVRPIEGAPVATPIDWEELKKPELSAQSYTIKNIFRRLGSKEDPWKNIEDKKVGLSEARKKLEKLIEKTSEDS